MVKRFIVFAVLFVAVVGVGVVGRFYHGSAGRGKCEPPPGVFATFLPADNQEAAPDAVFRDGAGARRTLADLRGKPVVLNFWATWCPPCVREMASLDRAKAAMADIGITLIAVSIDRGGVDQVRAFYRHNDLHALDILMDEGLEAARNFRVHGLPTTVWIDAGGQVVGRVEGAAEWDSASVMAAVGSCLAPARK